MAQSNQQSVSVASMFSRSLGCGFGLILFLRLRQFLGVSVHKKSRKKSTLKIFFFAPSQKLRKNYEPCQKWYCKTSQKSPFPSPHICLQISNVGNMWATRRRRVKKLPNLGRHACWCRRKKYPDTKILRQKLPTNCRFCSTYRYCSTYPQG